MSSSAELSLRNLHGDMLALFAGLLYAGYLISVERAREKLAPLPLAVPRQRVRGGDAAAFLDRARREIVPDDWTFVVVLALSSQVIGQGLLVYAIGALPPLVVGLALLTQPAISALVGWLAYGETLPPLDWVGAAAIAAALVLVRLPQRGLQPAPQATS